MNSLLTVSELKKKYKQGEAEIHVINGQNLEIAAGETLAIMGKSGSGKTTLLKMIGGLLPPSSGFVYFKGEDIYQKNEKERCRLRREKIGFVFQNYELIPELNVQENIIFPLLLSKKAVDKEYLNALYTELELSDKKKRYPEQLSGGEQQRTAIARALIAKPELILCDEPTGNLDEVTAKQVMEMLKNIYEKYKTAMIIVTHDKDIAAYADRVLTAENGIFR
jgi:ABC transporter, ATP-binding protein